MSDKPEDQPADSDSRLSREVGIKAARKLRARRQATPGIWFGLGMMGLVGWSIAIPTLLGAILGLWLDRGPRDRMLECLALGIEGTQGNTGG